MGLIQMGESANSLVLTKQNELLDSRRRTGLQRNGTMARPPQTTGQPLNANQIELG
jgi:hypothetical protein